MLPAGVIGLAKWHQGNQVLLRRKKPLPRGAIATWSSTGSDPFLPLWTAAAADPSIGKYELMAVWPSLQVTARLPFPSTVAQSHAARPASAFHEKRGGTLPGVSAAHSGSVEVATQPPSCGGLGVGANSECHVSPPSSGDGGTASEGQRK